MLQIEESERQHLAGDLETLRQAGDSTYAAFYFNADEIAADDSAKLVFGSAQVPSFKSLASSALGKPPPGAYAGAAIAPFMPRPQSARKSNASFKLRPSELASADVLSNNANMSSANLMVALEEGSAAGTRAISYGANQYGASPQAAGAPPAKKTVAKRMMSYALGGSGGSDSPRSPPPSPPAERADGTAPPTSPVKRLGSLMSSLAQPISEISDRLSDLATKSTSAGTLQKEPVTINTYPEDMPPPTAPLVQSIFLTHTPRHRFIVYSRCIKPCPSVHSSHGLPHPNPPPLTLPPPNPPPCAPHPHPPPLLPPYPLTPHHPPPYPP